MAKTKAERLLNLVIALLNADRFRDVAWIRSKVDGYEDATSDEAFFRMFERDKTELRDLGIPLQTSADGSYRIPPGDYALPELSFTPGEKAALALAGRLWETTVLAEAGSAALRKLGDATATDDHFDEVLSGRHDSLLQPRVRTSDPAFQPLYAAVRARKAVTFDYRKGAAQETTARSLQPWGLVSWRGRWYVVGHDVARGAQRTFRLSRIAGPVKAVGRAEAFETPMDVDLLDVVAQANAVTAQRDGVLLLRAGTGAGFRRRGTVLERVTRSGEDYDRVRVPIGHLWDTARAVTGLGPDAVVESPDDLLDAVVRLLEGARGGEIV